MSSCSSGKGDVHNMKPLSEEEDSRKLFNNRIFGPEGVCPPQFLDVSSEILKKCVAIITVASILACQPTRLKDEWEQIQDCLLTSQAPTNSTLTDMMHILDLSYKFLPLYLKACFLYLGSYPEDHEIEKDELVRKLVAEGFVSGQVRRSAWDVAESMIQLAYRDYAFFKKPYYKVHDMMLDLILKRHLERINLTCVTQLSQLRYLKVAREAWGFEDVAAWDWQGEDVAHSELV
ncbi:unnamed protein product [Miscanthus lutarioriparius]|nr:unnamed protein product [Miscanthus lutarioriparius]